MNRRMRAVALGATALAVSSVAVSVPALADDEAPGFVDHEVVASGLNNPRQIDQGPGGTLLVAEAGTGGTVCEGEGPEAMCLGATGSVTQVSNLKHEPTSSRIVTGLLSGAGPDGSFALGATGVEDDGRGNILISFNDGPSDVPGVPGEQAGQLLRLTPRKAPLSSRLTTLADIAQVEIDFDNPDGYVDPERGPELDSNPYGVLALKDGRTIVADAAGNTLVEVDPDGDARPFVVLPQHGDEGSRQSVPTALTLGGDGYIYVAELAHEEADEARVWKISQSGQIMGWIGQGEGALLETPRGLTTLVGVAVGRNGDLFVTELFAADDPEGLPGRLTRIDGRTGDIDSVAVPFPGGVTFGKDQKLYVSAFSTSTAEGMGFPGSDGQVWRVDLDEFDQDDPEPQPVPTRTLD